MSDCRVCFVPCAASEVPGMFALSDVVVDIVYATSKSLRGCDERTVGY